MSALDPQAAVLFNPPQIAALMEYRDLKNLAPDVFPQDVIARADELWAEIGSIGAYSHSQGVPLIRKHVAEFIQGQGPLTPICYIVMTHASSHL